MVIMKGSKGLSTGTFRVRDPSTLLKTLLLLLGVGTLTLAIDWNIYLQSSTEFWTWSKITAEDNISSAAFAVFFNVLFLVILFRLIALWGGVKVDMDNGTLEFPGGNVSANDFIDYFKPSFLFQYFIRYTINIGDIRELYQKTEQKVERSNIGSRIKYRYAIAINGSFGAASIWFSNEGKCDEIYSAIRQINNMGEPIFNA